MSLKVFLHNSDLYIRVIPSKALFSSTMVHQVVNRGDVFAVRLKDQLLTILPGGLEVEHREVNLLEVVKDPS
jgi:hypothetical protein